MESPSCSPHLSCLSSPAGIVQMSERLGARHSHYALDSHLEALEDPSTSLGSPSPGGWRLGMRPRNEYDRWMYRYTGLSFLKVDKHRETYVYIYRYIQYNGYSSIYNIYEMWQKPTKSSARETIKQEHHCELMVSYIGFAYSPADHDPIQYLF